MKLKTWYSRLLSLLLLHIIVALAVQQVNGSWPSSNYMPTLSKKSFTNLNGGNPYVKKHLLVSRCSFRHVQMKLDKKINAKGKKKSRYAVLRFESDPSGGVRIQGDLSKKFLCFSKKGRLIARSIGDSQRCLFREEPHIGYIKLRSAVQPQWYVGFNTRGRRVYGFASQFKGRRRLRHCFMFTKTDWGRRRHSRGPFRKGDIKRLRRLNRSRNR